MKIPDCQGPSRESVGSGERSPAFCFFEQVFFMGLGEFGPKCNVFQLKRHVVDKGIIFIYRIDIISERAPLHNVYMPTRGDAFLVNFWQVLRWNPKATTLPTRGAQHGRVLGLLHGEIHINCMILLMEEIPHHLRLVV